MTEETKPEEETPESPEEIAQRKKRLMWRLYGWGVIITMIIIVVLNLFQLLNPDINRILLPVTVLAYVIYIFFRRRV